MSISLKNHEDRITALESITQGSFKSVRIMRTYLQLYAGKLHTYDITGYTNYDFVYIRWDCWGGEHPETQSTDSLLPIGSLKQGWYQATQLWDPTWSGSDGVQLNISGTTLNLKHQGTEGLAGVWQIELLKLYYSFSYNIIYRATHLLEKIFLCLKQRRC